MLCNLILIAKESLLLWSCTSS